METHETGWTEKYQTASEPDFYGKWISVENKLPQKRKKVLVNVNAYGVHFDRIINGEWREYKGYVTHWMPLPNPPEDK